MSAGREHLKGILAALPDTFDINGMTLNPVIQTGHHAIVFHEVSIAPVPALGTRYRDTTWVVAVVSPLTNPEAAVEGLEDAVDEVLAVLESADTLRWSQAAFEPYNDRLWCFSVEVQIYNEVTPDPEPEPEPELVDLDALTVAELRTYAADHDIDLTGARLKADIVKAISLAPADPIKE
jgi:hypothetical protein